MPRNCVDSADNVCYICGEVTFERQRKAITAIVKKAYNLYFGCKIGDQDKSWAPNIWCRKCATLTRNVPEQLDMDRQSEVASRSGLLSFHV